MSFLRGFANSETVRVLSGDGVQLRAPAPRDYPAWAALRTESRSFLEPWEPLWSSDELTRGAFRRRLRRYQREMRADKAFPFFIHRVSDGVLLGGATLSNVRRGVAQTCALGYWMGAPFAGQGYMSAAVRALLPFAFGDLGLHRVEAACLPHNVASRRLLEKLGFQLEGFARCYLKIAGEWQDHLLFARLSSDPEVDLISGSVTAQSEQVWRAEAIRARAQKETL